MGKLKVSVINHSHHPLPQYESEGAAGLDLRAFLDAPVVLKPMERAMIATGLHVAIPQGYEIQIRPRSGLAIKHGITVINSPGTIDSDYRGEIKIGLVNLSQEAFTIEDGERIAQAVIAAHAVLEWESTDELDSTVRGAGGFGHTGLK